MKRIILAAALAVTLPAASAQAQHGSLTRSFVSSSGQDTNPCTITAPCATFAVAYTKISANGIIAALDPGKYGPLTGPSAITGPVTINGNGWAAITGPAGGAAISINAGDFDAISLSGLEIDGAAVATYGILSSHEGSLNISNCIIRQFQYGILLNSTGDVELTDSTIANTTTFGVLFAPVGGLATFTFDHVRFLRNNGTAVSIDNSNDEGHTHEASGFNSLFSGNSTAISTNGDDGDSNPHVTLDNINIVNNTTGIALSGGFVYLSRSTLSWNTTGYSILGDAVLLSTGNNLLADSNNIGTLGSQSTH
jgi:hypothetical protein